jgi:hypothetical protein
MAVLSVDLAFRRWSDLGIVVLSHKRLDQNRPARSLNVPKFATGLATASNKIACEIISWRESTLDPNPVDAEILAGRLNHLCGVRDIRVLLLDGPQAWKSRFNGLEHSRVSERQLNTAAKTGLPGMVKPVTYRPFAEFCLDVYEALCRRGWKRLETRNQPGSPQERVLVECYPYGAWKSLGIKPLPSKRRARISDLAEAYGALQATIPFSVNRLPNHDQLQAIVGGLPGLALEEDYGAARIVGNPPCREEGHWREGFIVLPVAPIKPIALRWLH